MKKIYYKLLTGLLYGCLLAGVAFMIGFVSNRLMERGDEATREKNLSTLRERGKVKIVPQSITPEPSGILIRCGHCDSVKDSVLMYITAHEIFDEQVNALSALTEYYDVILYTK